MTEEQIEGRRRSQRKYAAKKREETYAMNYRIPLEDADRYKAAAAAAGLSLRAFVLGAVEERIARQRQEAGEGPAG